MTNEFPAGTAVIGPREITKSAKQGKLKKVIVAKNCPEFLIKKIKMLKVDVVTFDGDQKQLGTKLGKPFPVTMAGYP